MASAWFGIRRSKIFPDLGGAGSTGDNGLDGYGDGTKKTNENQYFMALVSGVSWVGSGKLIHKNGGVRNHQGAIKIASKVIAINEGVDLKTPHEVVGSDVYSFRVILMELLTGQKAVVEKRPEDDYFIVDWLSRMFSEKNSILNAIDETIEVNVTEQSIKKIFALGSHCCANEPEQRPDMAHVVKVISSLVEDCEVHEAINSSSHAGGAADISHELQGISCRDSGHPPHSLWVDKYLPRSASEVCGNTESVKLMNEWLCQWHERGFQPSKDFLSSDEEKSQDADYNCSESDSDSENIGAEDRLKNVLLIVGPVGSGKSAAVHACAKEQGFKILESNASECRSGTVVRQKFGEALKSYSLSRSLEPLSNSCTDGNGVEDVIEVAHVLHIQNDKANLNPLILFEDVDITFAEDRGLVSAIQQIAEKAKGHVILTANDKNHSLPDNLERIEICFSLPSNEDLFSHLSSRRFELILIH